jgi:hypothetical protein
MADLRTLEEYKQYVKELKSKVRRLQDKNKELVAEVITLKAKSDSEKVDVNNALFVTKKATKLQAIWRGILARRLFRKKLRAAAKDSTDNKRVNTNQSVMIKAAEAAQKINFSLEMIYRAADIKGTGMVYLEDFKLFLKKIRLPLAASHQARLSLLTRFLYLIDEDCLGVLRKEDFQTTLAAYGVATELEWLGQGGRSFEQQ